MIVYIMRHGRAEDSNPDGDAARELTSGGKAQVRLIGEAFAREAHPLASLISSPLTRTVQTAQAFLQGADASLAAQTDPRLASGTRSESMLEVIEESALPILLIGHMPDVSSLVSYLASGSEGTRLFFDPGTMACVRFPGRPRAGAGALTWMRQPSHW